MKKELISELIGKKGRIFIVPLDHPDGKDTEKLSKIGIQNFVNNIDSMNFDGYIFHSRYYIKNPIKTKKDFFLTVGEQPDNYKADIDILQNFKEIKNVTIFFEVDGVNDKKAVSFYKEYVKKLKEKGYVVMGMGYPSEKYKNPDYQIVANAAHEIGCDYFKTDLIDNMNKINLRGMKLFIAGGPYLNDDNFKKFVEKVKKIGNASVSFGRNIFESKNYQSRINLVIKKLG
ncbi:MAG: hypothetical protein AABX54_03200 [Nanoarchaeota archaeon]